MLNCDALMHRVGGCSELKVIVLLEAWARISFQGFGPPQLLSSTQIFHELGEVFFSIKFASVVLENKLFHLSNMNTVYRVHKMRRNIVDLL